MRCFQGAGMDDKAYMQLALEQAQLAFELGEVPIGAVLVLDGQVIARAHNRRETWHDATAHAELMVIQQACRELGRWRLSGATLYVTIEPCPMCAGAMVLARIDRVVYGSPDPKAGAAESLFNVVDNQALNHRLHVTAVVLEAECRDIMKAFFRSRRKKAAIE